MHYSRKNIARKKLNFHKTVKNKIKQNTNSDVHILTKLNLNIKITLD